MAERDMNFIEEQPMTLSDALICLEDDDRLLFCHSAVLAPVCISRGKEAVRRLLFEMDGLTRQEVCRRFPEDVGLFDLLVAHDVLVPVAVFPGDRQDRRLARTFADNAADRRNMAVYLLMSQKCNLACVYCLNGQESYRSMSGEMPAAVACRAIRLALEQVAEQGNVEVIFFGGEPLLNWQGIKDTVSFAEETITPLLHGKTIVYHLTSNFTLLPDDFPAWAKKHRVSLLCDIDGREPVHDQCRPFQNGRSSYGDIVVNLRKLIAAGLPVVLRATVTSLNVSGMEEIALLHKDLGGAASLLVPVNPVNSDGECLSEQLLPDVEKLLAGMRTVYQKKIWPAADLFPFNVCGPRLDSGGGRVYGCAAPYGNIWVVDVRGDVYPCTHVLGMQRYYLGNLQEADFPRNEPLLRMAGALDVDNLADCSGCGWRYLCGGGCAVTREMVLMNDSAPAAVKEYCRQLHCRFETQAMELLLWEKAEE